MSLLSVCLRAFLAGIMILPFPAYGRSEEKPGRDTLNADRPDQTESPHIVSRGKLQLEGGLILNPFDSSGGKTPVIGMLVLRYGISRRLELRLVAEDGRDRDRFLTETTQGVYPLAVGGKVLLLEREGGVIPQIALLSWIKLPFTSRSSEQVAYWSPQVLLACENKLSEKFELEYNIGAKQEPYNTDWQSMGSLSLHVGLSRRMKLFAEYFGQYEPGEDPVHNADGGLMYLVSPDMQLDLAVGRSISAPATQKNTFAMAGVSLRLPH